MMVLFPRVSSHRISILLRTGKEQNWVIFGDLAKFSSDGGKWNWSLPLWTWSDFDYCILQRHLSSSSSRRALFARSICFSLRFLFNIFFFCVLCLTQQRFFHIFRHWTGKRPKKEAIGQNWSAGKWKFYKLKIIWNVTLILSGYWCCR